MQGIHDIQPVDGDQMYCAMLSLRAVKRPDHSESEYGRLTAGTRTHLATGFYEFM